MLVWTVLTEEAVDSSRLRCDEESGHLEGVRRPMGVYALHRRPRFMLQLEAGRDDPTRCRSAVPPASTLAGAGVPCDTSFWNTHDERSVASSFTGAALVNLVPG